MTHALAPRIGTAVTTLFMLLLVTSFATRSAWLFALYAGVALAIVLTHVRPLSTMRGRDRLLVVTLAVTMTAMLPISALRNGSAIVYYVATPVALAAAWLLTRDLEGYCVASKRLLLLAQSVILVYLAYSGPDDFPLENLLPESSSNGVTSYLVLLQSNYALASFLGRRRATLPTALATLAICIVGYGRGSLLTAAGIVVVSGLAMMSLMKPRTAVLATVIAFTGAAALFTAYEEEVVAFVEVNTKIGSGLDDEPRQQILNDYLGRIDAATVFIGADYRGTSIELDYRNNPHNSYLRAHHVFGLPYLLAILAFPIALGWRRMSLGAGLFAGSIILLILFRAFTEPILFPTPFDFFYFAVCFLLAHRRRAELHGVAR